MQSLYLVLLHGSDASGTFYWPIQVTAGSEEEASQLACEEAQRQSFSDIVVDEIEALDDAPASPASGIAEVFGRSYYTEA